jgi:hypothetical protein
MNTYKELRIQVWIGELQARQAAMEAANAARARRGEAPAYDEDAFNALAVDWRNLDVRIAEAMFKVGDVVQIVSAGTVLASKWRILNTRGDSKSCYCVLADSPTPAGTLLLKSALRLVRRKKGAKRGI